MSIEKIRARKAKELEESMTKELDNELTEFDKLVIDFEAKRYQTIRIIEKLNDDTITRNHERI